MQDPLTPSLFHRQFAGTRVLLALLIVIDLLFVLVHVLHVWSPWLSSGHLALDADRGVAEQYQYIKLLWLSACMVLAFIQTRAWIFLAWTALFGFLLLDDVAQLHERAGTYLALLFGFPAAFGLRAKDFGEITFAAGIGSIALVLVMLTYWRGSALAKTLSADVLCLLCALAFFGVFFDALHTIAFFEAPALSALFTLIEDGGEMVVVSIMTAYAFDIASNFGQLRIGLWSRLRPTPREKSLAAT